ncbi:MAG: DUF3347 domain-containing protein [Armatimonadetes bacterium]|nr:DUF3347 domain-containing protein [Armatimonadota bacterium]
MKKSIIAMIMVLVVLSINLFGDNSFNETMDEITVEYLKIKDTIANDKTENVNENAKIILELAKKLDVSNVTEEHKEHFKNLPKKITLTTEELSKAENITEMRSAFNDLSKPMAMWASMIKPAGLNVAYCSMAPGSWLQTGTDIRNPYFGASMLKCGEIVSFGNEITEKEKCKSSSNCEMSFCADKIKTNEHVCTGKCDHKEMMRDHKCEENCDHHGMEKKHVCDENCDHS